MRRRVRIISEKGIIGCLKKDMVEGLAQSCEIDVLDCSFCANKSLGQNFLENILD